MANKKAEPIDAFLQHGIVLEQGTGNQAIGDCPFCGKEGKLYVNTDSGAWDCKRCGLSGGIKKFLELKGTHNKSLFRGTPALKLSKSRGLKVSTFRAWGVGFDGEQYTIPVNLCGKTYDLRRYELNRKIRATTGGNVSLVGIKDDDSDIIWLCEGEWDSMALWEHLNNNELPGSVYGVTGGVSFPKHAIPYFQDKVVKVCLDNDDTGIRGAARIQKMLMGVARSMEFVHWPESFKQGFDVRDLYALEPNHLASKLQEMMKDYPRGTEQETDNSGYSFTGKGLKPKTIVERYREWLYLPYPEVLSVMYGSVLANRLDGDPLWMFFVAPPGGSKTELLMTLYDAPLITSTTSLTPQSLLSGVNMVGGGDPSLIPRLNNKVLIVKDFTTILELPITQRDEIFGILRDAYDGKCEKYFGNGIHRSYTSKFGILAGVTPVIEMFGAASSMLGERFLKYRLPQNENVQTGGAVIKAALNNIAKESSMREKLKEIAAETLNISVTPEMIPKLSNTVINRLMKLAQWVSVLRGVVRRERYTNTLMFKPTQEVGTRIAKQLAKLGMGVAIFHREKEITEEVYQVIVSVARSTCPDRVEELVKQLYLHAKDEAASTTQVAEWSRLPEATVRELLGDLQLLKVVTCEKQGYKSFWKLSKVMIRLMRPLNLYPEEFIWRTAKKRIINPTPKKKMKRRR